MTVYQEGYICAVCGPVTAKLWWSNEENDLVASCTRCGAIIQRIIPVPFSTPLAGGGKRPGQPACIPNSGEAPAPPQEDTA